MDGLNLPQIQTPNTTMNPLILALLRQGMGGTGSSVTAAPGTQAPGTSALQGLMGGSLPQMLSGQGGMSGLSQLFGYQNLGNSAPSQDPGNIVNAPTMMSPFSFGQATPQQLIDPAFYGL